MAPRFDAVGIAVKDIAVAAAFYRMLGLDFGPDDTAGHVEATTPSGIRLMLDTDEVMANFDPGWTAPHERGRIGLAFECADATDVDATHDRIVAAGYESHLEPFDAHWGQRYASLVDPDGNVIDLSAPLDG